MPTLYVCEQGSMACKAGGRVVVRREGETLAAFPLNTVEEVVLVGSGAHASGPLVRELLMRGVDLVYVTQRGRVLGRLVGTESRSAQLRLAQLKRASDARFSLAVARRIVRGKILNQKELLRRRGQNTAGESLKLVAEKVAGARSREELMGLEGVAGAVYFSSFADLVESRFRFPGRRRRPPTDPVNSLLSLGYALLLKEVMRSVQAVGFDPSLGFLHAVSRGRPSLALDMQEEFRALVVDSLVLDCLQRRLFQPGDFEFAEGPRGMCRLGRSALQRFVRRFDGRMEMRRRHPTRNERVSYRSLIALQVRHLATLVEIGEQDYRPLGWA